VSVQSVTEKPVAMTHDADAVSTRASWLPLVLIVSLFFLWGVANNLNDVLIAQFKKAFVLSDFGAGLVQSAFYLGYFLVAMPAGMYMRRFGYKSAVVFGLMLYGLGALLFWPAASLAAYGLFLFALFVIASGLAFLETSANPFVTLLGPSGTLTHADCRDGYGGARGVFPKRNSCGAVAISSDWRGRARLGVTDHGNALPQARSGQRFCHDGR
jgi:MFS family permease